MRSLLLIASLLAFDRPLLVAAEAVVPRETRSPLSTSAPRGPAALVLDARRSWLLSIHEKSESVAAIDLSNGRVRAETRLEPGDRPVAGALDASGRLFVAARGSHRVIALSFESDELRILARSPPIGRDPVDLANVGGQVLVTCARDDSIWALDPETLEPIDRHPSVEGARRLLALPPNAGRDAQDASRAEGGRAPVVRLVVAGRTEIAVHDARDGRMLWRESPARGGAINLDGLAALPDGFALAHQVQPSQVEIAPQMIVWGLVLANRVTTFRVGAAGLADDAVRLADGALRLADGDGRRSLGVESASERVDTLLRTIVPLDVGPRASGDPGRLASFTRLSSEESTPRTRLLVPSAGTQRLLLVDPEADGVTRGEPLRRADRLRELTVGARPRAVVVSPDARLAYVACALDDTIDVVDLVAWQRIERWPLRATSAPSEVELGERIFYDSRRSDGGWYSCHSCHPDGETDGHSFDTVSDGGGLAKRSPSLLGVAETGPWSWSGGFETLEAQVASSLHRTMAVDHPALPEDVARVVAFLRTLEPRPLQAPPPHRRALVARGAEVFAASGCETCHEPPSYSIARLANVGTSDELDGRERFNPPSLRGVRDRRRWLHDGRASSLREIFREHNALERHGEAHRLTADDLDALLAFLDSL